MLNAGLIGSLFYLLASANSTPKPASPGTLTTPSVTVAPQKRALVSRSRSAAITAPPLSFRQLARQANVSEAVILLDGETKRGFPDHLCAFELYTSDYGPHGPISAAIDLVPVAWCQDDSQHCIYENNQICCGYDGDVCSVATACRNADITGSWLLNGTPYVTDQTLLCPTYSTTFSQCGTRIADGSYTMLACHGPGIRTIYRPSEILSNFAGHTLQFITQTADYRPWRGSWNLTAITPQPPTELPFTAALQEQHPIDTSKRNSAFQKGLSVKVHGRAPSCANSMASVCPAMDIDSILWLYGAQASRIFCNKISNISCPGLCLQGADSTEYLKWILSACSGYISESTNSSGFEQVWVDYNVTLEASYWSLWPWNWTLTSAFSPFNPQFSGTNSSKLSIPLAHDKDCPSVKHKLASFAIINAVVFGASVFLCRREVIYRLTCHCCGKKGSKMWPLTALLSVGLNMSANVVNAILTKASSGFEHVPLGGLILLWSSRPRIGWCMAGMLPIGAENSTYTAVGVSAMLAELLLQISSAFYLGRTVNHARKTQYLLLHHLDGVPHGTDARIMYGGAVLWISAVGILMLVGIVVYSPVAPLIKRGWRWLSWRNISRLCSRRDTDERFSEYRNAVYRNPSSEIYLLDTQPQHAYQGRQKEPLLAMHPVDYPYHAQRFPPTQNASKSHTLLTGKEALEEMGLGTEYLGTIMVLVFFMILPFVGQWLFWAGFIRMAGDAYCPPQLWSNTAIWAVSSIAAIFVGASL